MVETILKWMNSSSSTLVHMILLLQAPVGNLEAYKIEHVNYKVCFFFCCACEN